MRTFVRRCAVAALAAGSLCTIAPAVAAHATDVATFHGLTPARLMDTRSGASTIDGAFSGLGPIALGATRNVSVVGRGGVPATGVGAVALNVTVTNPTGTGYLTVFPTGQPQPTASNLNFTPGQTIPNMALVAVGAGGQVSIFNSSGNSDVIVDVLGWFPTGAAFTGVNPARLLETRLGFSTIDGISAGAGPVIANGSTQFVASGRGSVPSSGVGAVALNVTVTNPSLAGYLTVFPTGSPRPTASNLNFVTGLTIPNMVIVPLGTDGRVSIFNGSGGNVDVIVDVLGWFPTGSAFTGLTPARVLDTRIGQPTVDGLFSGFGKLFGDATMNVRVTGRGGVPATGVGAVALNVTVTNPTSNGYLTVYPSGNSHPTASNLNFVPYQTIPNMVIVPVGNNGQIAIYNSGGDSDIIVDVLGWFPNPTEPPTAVGNALTLRSDGLGANNFGAQPSVVISAVSALYGPPTINRDITFTYDPASMVYESPEGELFAFPFGKNVCWHENLCIDFGGVSTAALGLTGYSYYSDFQALLFDSNGLGMSSRAADWPGTYSYQAAGCYAYSTGTTATGILVSLISRGAPFGPTLPAPGDVYITGFYAGYHIYSAEGEDC